MADADDRAGRAGHPRRAVHGPRRSTGSTSSPCRPTRWPRARSTSSCCAPPPRWPAPSSPGPSPPAGGTDTWIERADAHDLVDAPTRVLGLATRTALDAAELPLALRQLLGRCTIRSLPAAVRSPAGRGAESAPVEGVLEDTVMRLRDPSGGVITVERPYLPFTPTEFARARALVELDARLGPRVPRSQDVLTLPEGNEITVRRADPGDLDAARGDARALLARAPWACATTARSATPTAISTTCSARASAAPSPCRPPPAGSSALGHLLWDGDETEVALLVEDDWQRRGIGAELLGRLVALAVEAGCESVYAVTQASNTGMVAAMRGLGLPLDYQIEEGTLVDHRPADRAPGAARPTAGRPLGTAAVSRRTTGDGPGPTLPRAAAGPGASSAERLSRSAHRSSTSSRPTDRRSSRSLDARGPPVPRVHDAVADRGRVLDEGVHAAEADRRGDQPDPGDHLVRVAVHLEGDHRAADPRVVDAGDARDRRPAGGRVRRRSRRRPGPVPAASTGRAAAGSRPAGAARRRWRTAPAAAAAANSSSQATTPPITSPWPPRYLVALCSTSRAPCSAGRWSTGVAKVLSASSGHGAAGVGDGPQVDLGERRVGRGLDHDQARCPGAARRRCPPGRSR